VALRAIILVGGEGTRLRPLTFTRPKPVLPIGGLPMLARKLAHLAEHGVTDAVLSLGYKPDAFTSAFPSGEISGVRVIYAVEPAPLDTAGAIRFAAEEAGYLITDDNDPIIAVNGDTITSLDLTAQYALHKRVGAEATIALTQVEDPSAFGVVPTDDQGRVIAFVEKPPKDEAPTDWINAGAYLLERRFFARIPSGQRVSIERATFPLLVADRTLYAIHDPAYWIDAGVPSTYVQANIDLAKREQPSGNLIGPDTSVDASATINSSVIGMNCAVGPYAHVASSVVHNNVTIGANVTLDHAIIGNGVVIGDGARITGLSVIGDGAVVEPGAVFNGDRYPMPD
jgi:mannose-1-phosphate guanylyltransferase